MVWGGLEKRFYEGFIRILLGFCEVSKYYKGYDILLGILFEYVFY